MSLEAALEASDRERGELKGKLAADQEAFRKDLKERQELERQLKEQAELSTQRSQSVDEVIARLEQEITDHKQSNATLTKERDHAIALANDKETRYNQLQLMCDQAREDNENLQTANVRWLVYVCHFI